METRWKVFQASQVAHYDQLPLTNVPLFAEEDFSGCLLGFLPGQELPVHHHDHEHEVFDVLEGSGTMFLDGESIEVKAGSVIFVPAGVHHGFKNTSDSRWLIRATIHQRVYARHAIKRAINKRLGRARK
ncbi:MAG TPA: cupin domain-containing protein [Anaerolineae bacterium]|nr:cupin domain-containing protein [Anaerolineae bacterium]